MSDPVSEHPNTEKNIWESPAERQNRELQAEVKRLRDALQSVVHIRERNTRGSVGNTLGWKDEAAQVARAALAGERDEG